MSRRRNGETRRMILDYLIREADLDGLVTVGQDEVGAAVGITGPRAHDHMAELVADGLISHIGRAADLGLRNGTRGGGVNAYRIADSVLDGAA